MAQNHSEEAHTETRGRLNLHKEEKKVTKDQAFVRVGLLFLEF